MALETRLAPDLWPVEIDLSQVEQALANLVVNARDALVEQTPPRDGGEGGGRIVVSTENVPGAESLPGAPDDPERPEQRADRVCLAVADDGPGIPAAIRDKIFDPFFSTKETTGASGLGLATVYAVVDEAGGSIEVDSRTADIAEGGERPGTTVRLLLPRASRERTARARAAAPAQTGKRWTEHILLVDDEPEVRAATRELLAESGYRVAAVAGAEEALAAAAEARREGRTLRPGGHRRADRRRCGTGPGGPPARRRARVRALYMSGYTDRIALRTGPGRGDAFFLKKPFSGEGLLRMVRELLDESPHRDRP